MTYYVDIDVVNDPHPIGLDSNGRSLWVFNLLARHRPSTEFEHEIVALLVAAGVGTWETDSTTDILVGQRAQVEDGDGPYVQVIKTPGTAAERTHNSATPAYHRPGARIVVRATSYNAARTKAWACHAALWGVRNQNVTAV